MPRLSTAGRALMGIGGQITSVDGTTPPALIGSDGGGWSWYGTGTIFGQADFGGGYSTYLLQLSPEVLTPVSAGEKNETSAGGSNWATFTAGTGVETDVGGFGPLPIAGLGEVSETGQFALIFDRQADLGMAVYSALGVLQSMTNAIVIPAHGIRLRGDVLSYEDAAGWHLLTGSTGAILPFAARSEAITFMVPVIQGTNTWVLERAAATPGERLSIRRATGNTGFVVKDDGIGYNPDARMVSSTVVRIAYSLNSGESADALVMHDVNLFSGAHSKATIVAGAPVWVTQPDLGNIPLPTSGGSADARILLNGLYQQPLIRKSTHGGPPLIDERWYKALLALANMATAPINLGSSSQVTGILPQQNGGTGNDDAQVGSAAPVSAEYLVAAASGQLTAERVATDTTTIAWDFATAGEAKADVITYLIPLVDGSEPPNFITDGAGHLVLTAYNV